MDSRKDPHGRKRPAFLYWGISAVSILWVIAGMLLMFFLAGASVAYQITGWAVFLAVLGLLQVTLTGKRSGLRNAIGLTFLSLVIVYPGGSITRPLYTLEAVGEKHSAMVSSVRHEESNSNQALDSWYYSFKHLDDTEVAGPEMELHHPSLHVGQKIRLVVDPYGTVPPARPDELYDKKKLAIPWAGAAMLGGLSLYWAARDRRAELISRRCSIPGTTEYIEQQRVARTQEGNFRSRVRSEVRSRSWSGMLQVRADQYSAMGHETAVAIAAEHGLEPSSPKDYKRSYWTFRNLEDLKRANGMQVTAAKSDCSRSQDSP